MSGIVRCPDMHVSNAFITYYLVVLNSCTNFTFYGTWEGSFSPYMLVSSYFIFFLIFASLDKEWSLMILYCILSLVRMNHFTYVFCPLSYFFNTVLPVQSFDSFSYWSIQFLYVRAFNILKILNICHKCATVFPSLMCLYILFIILFIT